MTKIPDVQELIPHSGPMSLLSRVTDYGENWLQAEVDIHANSVFAETEGVPSWIGLEYLAQAAAAFSGIQQKNLQQPPPSGFLLGTRRYRVNTDWFLMGLTLTVYVERDMVAENGLLVFSGSLTGHQVQASAKINIFQPAEADLVNQEVDDD